MAGNILMLVVVLLYGLWGIANKYAVNYVSPLTAQWMYSIPFMLMIPVWYWISVRQEPAQGLNGTGLAWAMGAGLASLLAQGLLYYALQIKPASIVLSLTSTYPVVVMLYGILSHTEQLTPAKALGIALIGLGVVIVQASGG